MYLGKQGSMPPADIAVKIAETLGTTVEYLVTGKTCKESQSSVYEPVITALESMSEDVRESFINTVLVVSKK